MTTAQLIPHMWILMSLLISVQCLAQNRIVQYDYWFNNDAVKRVSTTLSTPVELLELNTAVPATGLSFGINTFNIRFKDNTDLWSGVLSEFFYKAPPGLAENREIVAYEYWYNNDVSSRILQPVAGTGQLNLVTGLNTAMLQSGINTFNIRFKDSAGLWSGVLSEFFYKAPPGLTANREIVAYEYWYNDDVSSRILQTVAGTGQLNLVTGLNAAMLQNGINTFNIRFKDNTGLWSSVLSEFFYKAPPAPVVAANREIVAYEYWYNNDVNSRILQTVESTGQLNLITGLDAALLQSGINTFNIRFKDNTGLWSSVMSEFFYKSPLPPQQGGNQQEENLIAAYEFWFEDSQGNLLNQKGDPGTTHVVPGEPINPLVLNLGLDMRRIPHGTYKLMFRFMDTRGLWSAVLAQEVEKIPYPWPLFVAPQTTFCGAGTVAFDNFSIDADTWLWDFGDGTTSTLPEPQHTYAQPGIYTVRLTAGWSATGQSNTLVMNNLIVVNPLPQVNILVPETAPWCQGEELVIVAQPEGKYLWSTGESTRQIVVNQTGSYSVTVTDINGCIGEGVTTVEFHPLPQPAFLYQVVDALVIFENTSQGAQSYLWDFGDGNRSEERAPRHRYTVAGPYEVCLTAFTDKFCPSVVCHTLQITTNVGSVVAQQELKAYPVPFDASLVVVPDPGRLWQLLEVYDAVGQRVLRLSIQNPAHPIRINTSNWRPGVYILILYTNDGYRARLKTLKK